MNKKIYLGLALIGATLPLTQFAPWTISNGLNFPKLASDVFANQMAAGVAIDAIAAAFFMIIYIILEQKKRAVKFFYLPIIGVFVFGLAFALPLYFYLRED